MQSELDRLHQRFRADLSGVRTEIADLQVTAADTANAIRQLLHAVGAEITDCPRLFTLSRDDNLEGLRRLRVDQQHYRLVLWCEQPDHWHPWTAATYDIDRLKEWLARVAPYALLVLRALDLMVRLASAVAGVGLPAQSADQIKSELDLMKAVLDVLPASAPRKYPGLGPGDHASPITLAEGAASRAARSLILHFDPWRIFGDLRRVQARSGEFLWVCPAHHAEHDPGLPALPA